jgi:hypothetical protein
VASFFVCSLSKGGETRVLPLVGFADVDEFSGLLLDFINDAVKAGVERDPNAIFTERCH